MLRFRPFQGPSDQAFVDPDTNYKFRAKSRQDLLKHILSYRAQNQLPILDALNATIDNYQCLLPENEGKCEENRNLHRGLLATIKGGISILVNVAYNKFASQAEADRRSEICRACKYNSFDAKSYTTDYVDRIALAMVGDKKSKYHAELGECSVCICPLKAKVFYEGTVELDTEQVEKMQPVKCWQLDILKQ